MKQINPFPYSHDNKRYYTWNHYLKQTYQSKIFKVALNANFSCPNRDGTCGYGGCSFCSSLGSGDCAGDRKDSLIQQFEKGKQIMLKKWPTGKAIAYFQAFTNTYAPLEKLKQTFEPFLIRNDIVALSIATRADCLEDEKIEYLQSLTKYKDIWLEIGLQTIHDSTARHINRGHLYQDFHDCIMRLKNTNLNVCVHLINSLPYESKEMMIATAKQISQLPIHAVKIHMLHLLKHTKMANEYQKSPFHILSKEEYIDIVIRQLEVLPSNMIIQRLTGDGIQEDLLEPLWTIKKVIVLNDIDKQMVKENTWQGRLYQKNTSSY